MKFKINLIILFLFIVFLSTKSYATQNKILFKVDNEIITSVDILNEIEYLSLLNKNLNQLKDEKIFQIAKNSIIREKIKIIELTKYFNISEVVQENQNILMNEFIRRVGLEKPSDLNLLLKNTNIGTELIEEKLNIELLWNQLIVKKYSKDIKIDRNKIKEEILKNNFQKEYLISEIIFNLEKSQKLNDKLTKIKNEIKNNGFSNAALIYSMSSSAKNGGKLGWIKLNSLNKKIKKQLLQTNIGQITDPIVIPGGFIILFIEDEKSTKIVTDINKEIDSIAREVGNKQLNQFSNIYFNKIKKEIEINEF